MISIKNHCVKTPAKLTSLLGLFLISILTFSSCENFLQGEDIKNEIVNAIEYNNSQSYPIRVEAIKGTGEVKLPLGGEISKKVTDTFPIKFVPADNCKFIKWEVVIPDLAKGELASDYIEIVDPESPETQVRLRKAKGSILIRPVCPQKLIVTDFNLGEGKVYKRDDTIKITFNNLIEEECKNNISVVIQGLEEELSSNSSEDPESTATTTVKNPSAKYFKTPEIADKSLCVYVDRKSGDAADLIPVPEGGTRNISVFLSKDKVYYINKDYSKPITVYLEEDFNKTYTINSETSDPTKMRFLLDSKTGGFFRVDDVTVSGSEVSYAVGKTLNLQYIPSDSCYFCGWKILRSYKDANGIIKTELATADTLSESNINFSFKYDDESNEWGYNARSGVAKAKLTIDNYTEGELTIEPLCLKLSDIKLSGTVLSSEKTYPRDSDIVLTFDKNVFTTSTEPEDNVFVSISELAEDKNIADYFNPLQITNNILTIAAKTGSVADLIPVEGTKKIALDIPAQKIYFEVKEGDETVKAYLAQNISYAYTINQESVNKTKVYFHIDEKQAGGGSLKVDEVTRDEQTLEYSVGKSFVLKFRLSNDYRFTGWRFTRNYKDTDGSDKQEIVTDIMELANLKLSIKYEDGSNIYGYTAGEKEGVAQATITVDGYISGTVKIEPIVSLIPTATIILEDNNGKISANNGVLSTLNGASVKLATTKEEEENVISFSPDTSYEFIKWQVYNKKTNEIYDNGQYINFTNPDAENTSYILVSAPEEESGIQLAIKPVIAERPQILDCTPSSTGTSLLRRDSTIQIIFDYDMDENSIYYTESELALLRELLRLPEDSDILDDEDDTTLDNQLLKSASKNTDEGYDSDYYYGYIKDGKTYYKNISIQNNSVSAESDGRILTGQFKEPVFDNPRTLTLAINRDKISTMPGYIQVLVNIGKIKNETGEGFFYTKEDKVVSMNGYKKWIYRVNNEVDTTPPTVEESDFEFKLASSSTVNIKSSTVYPTVTQDADGLGNLDYAKTPSLYLNLEIKDEDNSNGTTSFGSGLASNFTVSCYKLADSNYDTNPTSGYAIGRYYNYIFDYHTNDTTSGAKYVGSLPLTGLDEGVYRVQLRFKDQSGNECVMPKANKYYYFCYDKTSPFANMSLPVTITDGTSAEEGNGKLKLEWVSPTGVSAWLGSRYKDIKTTTIKYKKDGDSEETTIVLGSESSKLLSSLNGDTQYSFTIVYEDYAGNLKEFTTNAWTRPDTPVDVVVPVPTKGDGTTEPHGNAVTIKGTKPSGANYNNIRVQYREKTAANNGSWTTLYSGIGDISSGFNISSLGYGKTYEFRVSSYYSSSGKYSVPYINDSGAFPTYDTQPAAASITGSGFSSYTDQGYITYTPPSSNYTKLKLICAKDNNFSEGVKEKIYTSPSEVGTGSKTYYFTGLDSGTYYYSKVIAWYGNDENNFSVSNIRGPYSTKPNPVTDLSYSRNSNSITLSWTKPSGNYSSYYIYYRDITTNSNSTWSNKYISDKNTTSYSLTGLYGGHTYQAYVYSCANGSSSPYAYMGGSSSSSVQLYPKAVTGITTAKQSSTSIKISWTNPVDTYSKVYLYYATSDTALSSASAIDVTGSSSKTLTSLSTGQTYYFKLVSYINSTLKTESTILNCSTDIDPVSIAGAAGQNSTTIRLRWQNPSSYDGIRIYRGSTLVQTITSSNMSSQLYTTSTSPYTYYYDDTGLTPNTSYTYTITAYKKVNGTERTASAPSVTARSMAGVITMSTPTVNSSASVTLNWTNPNSAYFNYTYLYKKKGSGSEELVDYWNTKTKTTYTVTGLEGCTQYTFYLKTTDANGNLNYSSDSYKTITTPLAKVSNVTMTPYSTSRIDLSWTKPSGNYSQVEVYYKVYGSTADYTYKGAYTSTTSCSITGLSAYTTYSIMLRTYKSGYTSQDYTLTGYTKTYAARNLQVTGHGTTSLTVSCLPYNNNGTYFWYKKHTEPASAYKSVWVGTYAGEDYTYSKTITGLVPGTKYDIYATSCYYDSSNTVSTSVISYVTDPAIPTGVYATVKEGNVFVHWDKTAGNENYFLTYYKKHSDSSWTAASFYAQGIGTTSQEITGLSPYTQYDFYVISNYDYNEGSDYYGSSSNDNMKSAGSATCSLWTPPEPVTDLKIWSDDGMGTVIVSYKPSTSISYVDVFVNGTIYDWQSSSSSPSYFTVKIPNYKRGTSYSINVRAFHQKNQDTSHGTNGGENVFSKWADNTLSKSSTITTSTDGWIWVNGTRYATRMDNVITSSVAVPRKDTSSSSAFYGSSSNSTKITLSPYSIGAWEVLQDVYQTVMGNNPSKTAGTLFPVTNISWYAAVAFCNKLSVLQGLEPCYDITGYSKNDWKTFTYANVPTNDNSTWNAMTYHFDRNGYHLPTEWQWEFAARGGDPSDAEWDYTYSGSNTGTNVGWISDNAGGATHHSTTKTKNRLGLWDMTGNASEWLSDWMWNRTDSTYLSTNYTDPYVQYSQSTSSKGPARSGGSIYYKNTKYTNNNGIKAYDWWSPNSTFDYMGFRLCRNVTVSK